ncbi:hypothetical protein ANAEL_03549 [Anaerolineales bacterium]|nr:hypothetical protein ANAEL_03549 [Anaerolineales bacterium]
MISYDYTDAIIAPVRILRLFVDENPVMRRFRHSIIFVVLLVTLSGCTGESVRVVLPERHPANPSAVEAPFVLPPNPFAEEALPSPPPSEKPAHRRHGDHPGAPDDEMRMDDMRMDDDQGGAMMAGGHGMHGGEKKEGGQ